MVAHVGGEVGREHQCAVECEAQRERRAQLLQLVVGKLKVTKYDGVVEAQVALERCKALRESNQVKPSQKESS